MEYCRQYFTKFDQAKAFCLELGKHTARGDLPKLSGAGSTRWVEYKAKYKKEANKVILCCIERMTSTPGSILVGTFGGSILSLLHMVDNSQKIDPLVVDALKRSDRSLENASIDQISLHLQSYNQEQLAGVINNAKGIYHEMLFVEMENIDGDSVSANLHTQVNQSGSDVVLTDSYTGQTQNVQLKATDSVAYAEQHFAKNPDIPVYTTSEIAEGNPHFNDSGFSNEEITTQTTETVSYIRDNGSDLFTDTDFIEMAIDSASLAVAPGVIKAARSFAQGDDAGTAIAKGIKSSSIASAVGWGAGLLFNILC
jgi:hypothetical protein